MKIIDSTGHAALFALVPPLFTLAGCDLAIDLREPIPDIQPSDETTDEPPSQPPSTVNLPPLAPEFLSHDATWLNGGRTLNRNFESALTGCFTGSIKIGSDAPPAATDESMLVAKFDHDNVLLWSAVLDANRWKYLTGVDLAKKTSICGRALIFFQEGRVDVAGDYGYTFHRKCFLARISKDGEMNSIELLKTPGNCFIVDIYSYTDDFPRVIVEYTDGNGHYGEFEEISQHGEATHSSLD